MATRVTYTRSTKRKITDKHGTSRNVAVKAHTNRITTSKKKK
jgi:hypothetical protein